MLGFWTDCEGKVCLDGATLDQWDRGELARHIGYVSQDTQLLTGTVAQNISRFLPDAKPDQVLEAAQLAQVHEMIVTLPMGYDTVVGPGGMALSAGQRQRVSLARAFFGRPSLIILDEPNSNLDNHGDLALTRAIRAMRDIGSTVVVASHRPNAITEMGNVLVLRNGRQVAFGPNDKVVGIRSGERVFAITREAQS